MDEEREKVCIDALEKLLEGSVPDTDYCIYGYCDDAICLQKDGALWVVYAGYRNQKLEIEKYNTLIEACLGFIRKIYSESQQADTGSSMFLNSVISDKMIA